MGMVACLSPHVPVVEQAGSVNRLSRLRRSSLNVTDGCVCLVPPPWEPALADSLRLLGE